MSPVFYATRIESVDSLGQHVLELFTHGADCFLGGFPVDTGVGYRHAVLQVCQVFRNRLFAQLMLLSTIRLWIDLLPSRIWWVTSCITSGWMAGSLLELAWLQSTMMDLRRLAFSSACSHRATFTES